MSYHSSLYDDMDEPDFYADDYVPQSFLESIVLIPIQIYIF